MACVFSGQCHVMCCRPARRPSQVAQKPTPSGSASIYGACLMPTPRAPPHCSPHTAPRVSPSAHPHFRRSSKRHSPGQCPARCHENETRASHRVMVRALNEPGAGGSSVSSTPDVSAMDSIDAPCDELVTAGGGPRSSDPRRSEPRRLHESRGPPLTDLRGVIDGRKRAPELCPTCAPPSDSLMAARDIREWKITSAIEPVVICLFIVGRLSSKATSERDDERSRIIEGRSDGVCGGPSA